MICQIRSACGTFEFVHTEKCEEIWCHKIVKIDLLYELKKYDFTFGISNLVLKLVQNINRKFNSK